ncbi:MAG: alpha/beta fold hydrolase [Actinomycetota bacterium]
MPYVERPHAPRLYYEVAGDPRRPAIVLLEGLGGDVTGWRRNVPHLAAELFVVAYDHRGSGRSGPADEPTTMTTYVEDCLAVLDELRSPRAHVYGQSFGGAVALELALTHPDRVRSAILAATHPGSLHAVPAPGRAPKDEPWLQRYSPAFAPAHPEQVREDLGLETRRSRSGERRQWIAMRAWDAHDRLGDVTVPVLVLHGSQDRLMHPDNARLLAAGIPGAELVILEGAGHVYHAEQPERADEAVLDCVRRHRDR